MMKKTKYLIDVNRDLETFRGYLLQKENAAATVSKYLTDVRLLIRFIGDRAEIDKAVLLEFKEWLWANYKPASCNAIIAGINQFLESLHLGNLKLKRFRYQQQMVRPGNKYLTKDEFLRLLGTAKDKGKQRLAICMETIAFTGARVSELKYFTVESVKEGQVTIRNKGKIRTIYLPKKMKDRLLAYAAGKKIRSGHIFVTARGKPVDRSNFWREMQALQKAADVPKEKIFPHNLRHLFAQMYYEVTKDLVGLGDVLGHSSLNVTRIYTRRTEEMQKNVLNLIDTMLDTSHIIWCRTGTKKTT